MSQPTHNVFLIGDAKYEKQGTYVHEKLAEYAQTLKSRNINYLEIWNFYKLEDINTLLALEKKLGVLIRSQAFVFSKANVWNEYQYSKYSCITLVECEPSFLEFEPVDNTLPYGLNDSVYKDNINRAKLCTIFMPKDLSSDLLEKFNSFYKIQQEHFLDSSDWARIPIQIPYEQRHKLRDLPEYAQLFVVASGQTRLRPTTVPNGMQLIDARYLNNWTWSPTAEIKNAVIERIQKVKTDYEASKFHVIFAPYEMEKKDKMLYDLFYKKQKQLLEAKFMTVSTMEYGQLIDKIKQSPLKNNSKIFIISSTPMNPPKNMGLILVKEFEKWEWEFLHPFEWQHNLI